MVLGNVILNLFLFKITTLNLIELNLSVQRHICKDCKKTFSPSTSIAKDNSNISNNLKYTIAQELQENISLTLYC